MEGCNFHHIIKDIRGLVVRGPENEQNGVYELKYPNFFKHWKRDFVVYWKEDGWILGNGSNPWNVTKIFKSENSDSIPESGWTKGGRLLTVDIMKVNTLSKKAFTR